MAISFWSYTWQVKLQIINIYSRVSGVSPTPLDLDSHTPGKEQGQRVTDAVDRLISDLGAETMAPHILLEVDYVIYWVYDTITIAV